MPTLHFYLVNLLTLASVMFEHARTVGITTVMQACFLTVATTQLVRITFLVAPLR